MNAPFWVVPAIDLIDGQVVRLHQGSFNRPTFYPQTPQEVARAFGEAGALRLHVVDLDAARRGQPINVAAVEAIRATFGGELEIGGGLRSLEELQIWANCGVDRFVVGTALVQNPDFVQEAARRYRGRVVAGIDCREGQVAVEGWQYDLQLTAVTLAERVRNWGIEEVIYTDISRDGMLGTPDLYGALQLAHCGVAVYLSGGVSSLEAVQQAVAYADQGIRGVIIGRALYDGRMDLKAVISSVQKTRGR